MSIENAELPQPIVPFQSSGFKITINPEASTMKRQLLASAESIANITDDSHQGRVVAFVSLLKGLSGDAEKARKAIKDPYLRAGQEIDKQSKDFCKELIEQSARLERILGEYQRKKQQEAAEARRREQEEFDRTQRAAEKAAEKLAAAERERLRLEFEAEFAESDEDKAKAEQAAKAAEDAAKQAAKEVTAAELDRMESFPCGSASLANIASGELIGAQVKPGELEIEVTDALALALHLIETGIDPNKLIKIEARKAELKNHIIHHGIKSMPGVSIDRVTKVQVKGRSPLAS